MSASTAPAVRSFIGPANSCAVFTRALFQKSYCSIYFAVTAVVQFLLKDPSFFQMLAKCGFPLVFVALYPIGPLVAHHKLSRKEINLLVFVSAIGIIPFLMDWFTVLAFALSGNNM